MKTEYISSTMRELRKIHEKEASKTLAVSALIALTLGSCITLNSERNKISQPTIQEKVETYSEASSETNSVPNVVCNYKL